MSGNGIVREIPVQGSDRPAIVDECDYERIAAFAWRIRKGYAQGRQRVGGGKRVHFSMHRLILGLSVEDDVECDHVNRDRLDNRRSNLRLVTRSQNAQNQSAHQRWCQGPPCAVRGVHWDERRGKWKAEVRLNGRNNALGYYDDPEEAGAAAAVWRAEHMPFSNP